MENKYVTIPEPIPYGKIKISTFDLLYIKNMVITADINEHTELNLTGILSDDKRDEYIYKNINKPIKVYSEINNQTQTIYIGIVTELKLSLIHISINNLNQYFESFFGFKANSNDVDKSKLKQKSKNPIDTSDIFDSVFNNKKECRELLWITIKKIN